VPRERQDATKHWQQDRDLRSRWFRRGKILWMICIPLVRWRVRPIEKNRSVESEADRHSMMGKLEAAGIDTSMITFIDWLTDLDLLARLRLIETYYSFDPGQYNQLFQEEMEKLLQRITNAAHRKELEAMKDFDWVGYIASSIRRAGYQDQRDVQERTHDLVARLLTGSLFRGFDEQRSGPMPYRFKASVANAVKNMKSKDGNRRRYLPSVSIRQSFEPGGVTGDDLTARLTWSGLDNEMVAEFRRLVRERLGDLALAVLDARLSGQQTKALVGLPELGSPDKNRIKRVVQQLKSLGRSFAASQGDEAFARDVERALGREKETVAKRLLSTRQGQVGIEV
jgi:hypothetical protein